MKALLAVFSSLDPAYRHGAIWLGALLTGLLAGTAADDTGVPLFLLFFVPLFAIATVVLVISGFWSLWRLRANGARAAIAAVMPFAAVGLGAVIFAVIWSIRGVPPLVMAGTKDVQIDQTLASPDGKLKAVVLDDLAGGPATGVSKDIYVVSRPTSFFHYRDRVFSIECGQDFSVQWAGPRLLNVNYTVGQDGVKFDGVERAPVWVLAAVAHRVKVHVVRNIVSQHSLC